MKTFRFHSSMLRLICGKNRPFTSLSKAYFEDFMHPRIHFTFSEFAEYQNMTHVHITDGKALFSAKCGPYAVRQGDCSASDSVVIDPKAFAYKFSKNCDIKVDVDDNGTVTAEDQKTGVVFVTENAVVRGLPIKEVYGITKSTCRKPVLSINSSTLRMLADACDGISSDSDAKRIVLYETVNQDGLEFFHLSVNGGEIVGIVKNCELDRDEPAPKMPL